MSACLLYLFPASGPRRDERHDSPFGYGCAITSRACCITCPLASSFERRRALDLGRCESQGVVNRDIKLENTLLDSSPRPLVKICDFGYSKVRTVMLV